MKFHRKVSAAVLLCSAAYPLCAESVPRLFNRLELFTALSLNVPFDQIRDESQSFTLYREPAGTHGRTGWNYRSFQDAADLCSPGAAGGLRLSFRDADLRLYGTLHPVPFAVLRTEPDVPSFFALAEPPRYGASVSLSRVLPFPLSFQAGTLSPGGSWTRLSSPVLYPSVSPFTCSVPISAGLDISLPGPASGTKLPAAAVTAGVPDSWSILKGSGITAFFRNDGTKAASAVCRLSFPRMIRASLSLTGGYFSPPAAVSGDVQNTGSIKPSGIPAFCCQSLFTSPVFTSMLTLTATGQPSGGMRYTVRFENGLTFKHFSLAASGFAADGPNIRCTDNTRTGTLAQLRISPKYTLRFAAPRLPSLSAGASCLYQYLYGKTTGSTYSTIKYAAGTLYSDKYLSASLSFSSDGIYIPGSGSGPAAAPGYTVSLQSSQTVRRLRTSSAASCSFSGKGAQESFRFSFGAQTAAVYTTGTAGVVCRQKNAHPDGGSASASVTCAVLAGYVKYTFRLTLTGSF